VPVKVHIKEQKQTFQRFNAQWTPTQIVLDADGVERHRMEGFLPVDDFLAHLDLGLGKLHFQKQEYGEAEKRLRSVCESFPGAGAAPEACYWAGVSAYKGSNDARHLGSTARALKERYPDSEWARKASVWDQ
jgi:TolA-binding protein